MNKTLNIILLSMLLLVSCNNKVKNDSSQKTKKSVKESFNKQEKENHIEKKKEKSKRKKPKKILNPFYTGDMDKFNPEQIDFSNEFLDLETKNIERVATNITNEVEKYKLKNEIFETKNTFQNGIIGNNYKRIKVHISKATKNKNGNFEYSIIGKSNVNGNISTFKGIFTVISIYEIKKDFDYEGQGELFGKYEFYENKDDKYSGLFKGIMECSVIINHKNSTIEFDENFMGADGYANRTYVGIWKSYKTNKSKKCIWGDYRLPFTFDFDQGDGEMLVNKKYEKFGWKTFNDRTEFNNPEKWWK